MNINITDYIMSEFKTEKEPAGPPKLPYFHRTLSPEDQALLSQGPTRKPQRIDQQVDPTTGVLDATVASAAAATAVTTGLNAKGDGKLSTASAWNAAQSWEERDATKICKEKLVRLLTSPDCFAAINNSSSSSGSSSSTGGAGAAAGAGGSLAAWGASLSFGGDAGDIDGTGSVTHVRGKARFMYELSFSINFACKVPTTAAPASAPASTPAPATAALKTYRSKIKVIEAHNDQAPSDYDLSLEWDKGGGGAPSGPGGAACRKDLLGKAVREAVRAVMARFEADFHTL